MPEPKNHFTIGIVDDVTFTSLPEVEEIALGGKGRDPLFRWWRADRDAAAGRIRSAVFRHRMGLPQPDSLRRGAA